MILRFCSGSVTPASLPRNRAARVAMDERDVVVVAEERHDLLGLAGAQQAGVDEDAGELIADRLVQQHRRDRAESTPPDRPQITRPLPTCARMRAIASPRNAAIVQSPPQPATRCVKLREQRRAVRRVHHLGMELHAVEAALVVGDGGEGRALADCRRRGSPAAARSTRSPWLIHTCSRAPLLPEPVEQRAIVARSRGRRGRIRGDRTASTVPPSCAHIVCSP